MTSYACVPHRAPRGRARVAGLALVLPLGLLTPVVADIAGAGPASAASFVETNTIALNGNYVSALDVDPETAQVYAATRSSLNVVDVSAAPTVKNVQLVDRPTGLALSPDRSRIYLSMQDSHAYGRLDVVDRAGGTVAGSWNPGVNHPSGVVVDPRTSLVYVTGGDTYQGRELYYLGVVDPGTGRQITEIPINRATGVALDPLTSQVYVTHSHRDTVSIIDAPSRTVVAEVPVGDYPSAVDVDPVTSQIYVTNDLSGTVSVIDGPSRSVVATIPVGRLPAEVEVDARSATVYVANYGANTVSVIDGPSQSVVDTFPTIDAPTEIAVDPNGSRVYVASYFNNVLSVMEPSLPPEVEGFSSSTILQGEPFDYSYSVTGVPRPTTAVTAGALPPGLVLSPAGRLSGTPTEAGTYTFTVTGDSSEGSDDATSTIQVDATPVISGVPPAAVVGEPVDFGYDVSGSPAPTVTLTSGALPPGLTLGTDGRLSGIPTEVGSHDFTLTATNSHGSGSLDSSLQTLSVLTMSVADARADEGDGGAGEATTLDFTVSLNRPSTRDETVQFTTRDGTAQATSDRRSDYQSRTGTVVVPAGSTSVPIAVQVKGDRTNERDETFDVELTSTSGSQLLDATATGTIVNDDPRPAISIRGTRAVETNRGHASLKVPVRLDRPSSTPVTVRFRTVAGSARTPSDFAAASGTVTFPADSTMRTVTVRVRGDRLKERREALTVRLSKARGATVARASATVTIVDNDR